MRDDEGENAVAALLALVEHVDVAPEGQIMGDAATQDAANALLFGGRAQDACMMQHVSVRTTKGQSIIIIALG